MDKLKLDRKRYTAYKQKQNELKNLNEQIKTYEFVTKKILIQKKEYEITHIKDQLLNRKNLLQDNTERLTEVEGKVKILRSKGSSTVFA